MKSGWPISSFEHHHVSVDVALFWYDGGDSNLVLCWKKCYTWSILLKLQEARKLIIIMSNKQLVVIAVFTRGLGPYFCRNKRRTVCLTKIEGLAFRPLFLMNGLVNSKKEKHYAIKNSILYGVVFFLFWIDQSIHEQKPSEGQTFDFAQTHSTRVGHCQKQGPQTRRIGEDMLDAIFKF